MIQAAGAAQVWPHAWRWARMLVLSLGEWKAGLPKDPDRTCSYIAGRIAQRPAPYSSSASGLASAEAHWTD